MRNLPHLAIALSLTTLVGCKAIDAMDATDAMKKDLASMKATTAGMAGTTAGMQGDTQELKRKASIGEGIKMISDPENTREYLPPQVNMLAGAKLIAENMTSDELIKFLYGSLKEVDETVPDEGKLDRRYERVGGYSADYVNEFNRRKRVKVTIVSAIAAQIPQDMVETLVREQLQGAGGRFSDTMLATLELRASFLSQFFLDKGALSTTGQMDTLGKMRDARTYLRQLQWIVEQPVAVAGRVKFELNESAFLKPVKQPKLLPGDADYEKLCMGASRDPGCFETNEDAPNLNETLKMNIAKKRWVRLVGKINDELPKEISSGDSPYAREVAEALEEATRYGEQK